ncbi:MAG: beta-propeller domain-containing protein [Methanomassiliicoccales archaeon]|nr:beta-propeller domain-containing protein [Methanomassiliicoccales archaeon]
MDKSLVAIASLMVAVAVISTGTISYILSGDHVVPEGILPAFSNYRELEEFLGGVPGGARDSSPYMALAGENEEGAKGASAQHSNTNVRVEGIDEDDIAKTDGEFLYIASYDRVTIVKAYPPEDLRNVSVIDAEDALGYDAVNDSVWINGILLAEDMLIIIASVDEAVSYDPLNYSGLGVYWRQSDPRSVVSVFDVTDPASPVFEFSYGVSGYQLVTRMVDDKVYLVSQSYVWLTDNNYALPKIWNGSESSEMSLGEIHYDPESGDAGSFVNVIAIDLASAQMNALSIVAGYASTIYMSQDSLFVTYQKWSGGVIVLETGNVSGVEAVSASDEESLISTTIYKMSIEGISIAPAARGDVAGWLLDQFSIDEKDSYLRVATTTSWTDQTNAVYVLDEDLNVVGSLQDLAPGERIYASRFVGDTLYLVTFRQVDPLFVIDLGDPSNPRVLGQLHVPGFSSYLHPIDADHVLGIGMENGSVKISLFNVTDPSEPDELSRYAIGNYSWSDALWNYKSILFDSEKELLVFPVTAYDNWTYYKWWSSAYVFDVSVSDGVMLKGIIDHGNQTSILRTLYIGDYLYTISDSLVKVNRLTDLSDFGQLVYRPWSAQWGPYTPGSGGIEEPMPSRA